MKRIVILVLLFLAGGDIAEVYPQSWMNRLGRKTEDAAKRAVERNVEQKTEKAVDKAFDKAEDTAVDAVKGESKNEKDKITDAADNTEAVRQVEQVGERQTQKSAEMSWNKFDFVPGDVVMFDDQLVGEALGEFPSQWDLIEGNVEIARVDGENAISLYKTAQITPLIEEVKNYLPDVFTIELDFYMYSDFDEEFGKGIYQFRLMNENKEILDFYFYGHPRNNQIGTIAEYLSAGGEKKRIDAAAPFAQDGWHRFSLSFNKRALKIYIDQTRVVNVPSVSQPKWFNAKGDYTNAGGETIFYIRNVRIAEGAVPLYDRMMSEGKFITYGITFDVGQSIIKPESMGEINRIVQLMNENPDIKFSVEGHTDSTGNVVSNQTLSEARSKAIVDKLVTMGIAVERLTSVGKGQSSPIADNSTDEGRAKNRRVEFVKM